MEFAQYCSNVARYYKDPKAKTLLKQVIKDVRMFLDNNQYFLQYNNEEDRNYAFGKFENDRIFVRNDDSETDYEILLDDRIYSEEFRDELEDEFDEYNS